MLRTNSNRRRALGIIAALSTTFLIPVSIQADDVLQPPKGGAVSKEEAAKQLTEKLKGISGDWEYTDENFRGFTLKIQSNVQQENTADTTTASLAEKDTFFATILGTVTEVRPINVELILAVTEVSLEENRLVFRSISKEEGENYQIEIFDANSIDEKTKKIRLRITHPTRQSVVWYRFGRRLLFERKETVENANP